MCGVKVDGENHFVIAPRPGGHFTNASFTYDSIYGTVSCRWEKMAENEYKYMISIPENTSARVSLPGMGSNEVGSGRYEYMVS